jgi:hypothetical protein
MSSRARRAVRPVRRAASLRRHHLAFEEPIMSIRRAVLSLMTVLLLPGYAEAQLRVHVESPASDASEAEVRAVIDRLFEGMRTADSAMVRSALATGARFASVDGRATPAAIKYESPDGWIAAIASSGRRWDERVFETQIRVSRNIAQAWTPYSFYVDGKLRHCGVDAMELLRDASGWKITQLSDTQVRDGCREVPR